MALKARTDYSLNALSSSGPSSNPFRFREAVNEAVFAEINQCNILQPWKICYDDARSLGIRCFDQMRNAGLGSLMDLEEDIYPKIVKEFYSNLQFRREGLTADFYIRGVKGTLTEKFLANILECAVYENSIRIFDNIIYDGYSQKDGCLSLTGNKSENADYGDLDVESKILFHALCHIITPKDFNQVSANPREVFYMWCIRNGFQLNVPFIILSHMKSFLKGEVQDIPYGMLITRIAKYSLVYISNQQKLLYTEMRCFYNSHFLKDRMGIEREEEDVEASDAAPPERKRRRTMLTDSSTSSEEEGVEASTRRQNKGKGVVVNEEVDDTDEERTERTEAKRSEAEAEETDEDDTSCGFILLRNQIELSNQKLSEFTQVVTDGLLQLNEKVNLLQQEVASLRELENKRSSTEAEKLQALVERNTAIREVLTARLPVIEAKLNELKEERPKKKLSASLSLLKERVKKATTSLETSSLPPSNSSDQASLD